jgi:hypothetical protein
VVNVAPSHYIAIRNALPFIYGTMFRFGKWEFFE